MNGRPTDQGRKRERKRINGGRCYLIPVGRTNAHSQINALFLHFLLFSAPSLLFLLRCSTLQLLCVSAELLVARGFRLQRVTGRHPYSLSHNFIINMFSTVLAGGHRVPRESESREPQYDADSSSPPSQLRGKVCASISIILAFTPLTNDAPLVMDPSHLQVAVNFA